MNLPNLYAVLSAAIETTSFIGAGKSQDIVDGAIAELAQLQATIKALREQQARTDKVLADSVHGVKQTMAWNKRLDELQAENKMLKMRLACAGHPTY